MMIARSRVATILLACATAGCSMWWRADQEFFGRYLETMGDPSTSTVPSARGLAQDSALQAASMGLQGGAALQRQGQGGDAITAQGATIPGLDHQRLQLHIANHGRDPVTLSFIEDEYAAKTFNGRTIMLEKDDFLNYPDRLAPGDEKPVTLALPKDVPAREIAEIIAKIHHGKIGIPLRPIKPRESVAHVPEASIWGMITHASSPSSWAPVTHSPVSELWGSPLQPEAHVPIVPEPTGAPAKVDAPPTGTVPVVIELQQELGSALKAEVQWDATGTTVTLGHGDHRMFYVVPGQHELSVRSRMPSTAILTGGRVPVSVSAEHPLRIAMDARAKLSGVELRVRVWSGTTLASDQAFAPAAASGSAQQ